MTTEQQQMLAEATQAVLDRRFAGSVNAAHKRLRISRETITRMVMGWAPDLPTAEKWATALGEDVNRWRRLCGYPEVLPSAGRERLIVRLLSLALSYAVRWGEIGRNPCDLVDAPSPDTREMQVTDEAGILLLLDACRQDWLYLPVLLSVSTSLRRGEVLALRWSDVDLKTGLVHCRQAIEITAGSKRTKQPKTKRSRRPVELPAFAVEELALAKGKQAERIAAFGRAWQGGPLESSLVCCWEDGRPFYPDSLSSRFREVADSLGLPLRFHDLRHTHLSSLLAAGEPVTVVSERAGHSSPRLTLEVYGHVLPGQDRQAAKRFNQRMQDAKERKNDA